MKKVYNSPEMNVLFVEAKDVITVSVGTEGVMTTFDQVTKLKTITLKNILK